MQQGGNERRAISIPEFARMFAISRDSAKRHAKSGALRTIRLGGRRLVPVSEVLRVEREGIIPQKPAVPDFKMAQAGDPESA